MCGITLVISKSSCVNIIISDILNKFQEIISRRGPDHLGFEKWITENNVTLLFTASVLWLQGNALTKQPVHNENSILIYNGDIFNGITEDFRNEFGDTKYLFDILNESKDIHDSLCKLQGPYAFIFFDKLKNKIFFGRDKFGRRSLLIGKNENTLILSSTAKRTKDFEFMELPSVGTFSWDLSSDTFEMNPYSQNYTTKLGELEAFLNKTFKVNNCSTPHETPFIEPDNNKIVLLNRLQGLSINEAFSLLLNNCPWSSNVTKLKELLEDAVRRRISYQPKLCQMCILEKYSCSHSSVGVLFSGGVDCSILALLSDKFVDKGQPIDLFNISFDEANGFMSPDRVTGLQTLEELKLLCPDRNWRFIEINISKKELEEKRNSHIADLIYPLKTIIDDDLGCALWFASRGIDDSHCRVLIVGMGADELFGGYTKHRAAFKRDSWLGLHNKLDDDWKNLPYRNLARDDRVVSDHGRQLRTPYLDENVVNFVHSLQCWDKSFPTDKLLHGFGDKILLRCVAFQLGLKKASCLKKRALQFGSRIANNKEAAHKVSERLC